MSFSESQGVGNAIPYTICCQPVNLKVGHVRLAFVASAVATVILLSFTYFIFNSPHVALQWCVIGAIPILLLTGFESGRILNRRFNWIHD